MQNVRYVLQSFGAATDCELIFFCLASLFEDLPHQIARCQGYDWMIHVPAVNHRPVPGFIKESDQFHSFFKVTC